MFDQSGIPSAVSSLFDVVGQFGVLAAGSAMGVDINERTIPSEFSQQGAFGTIDADGPAFFEAVPVHGERNRDAVEQFH